MLYLVATPIGNLEDMTFRAVRLLREVSLIAAEDTRTTGKLLKHYAIETPMISYHDHSQQGKLDILLEKLALGDVALVSDAGTPGLSDPGYRLVEAALAAGHQVVPIPGATAAISALVASGLPTDAFLFLGFLPRQQSGRRAALADVAALPFTLIFYEAPHRLLDMLADVAEVLGERQVAIGRELTKLHEEIWRGTAKDAIAYFEQGKIRGELTVVVAGASAAKTVWDEAAVRGAMAAQLAAGVARKQAAAAVAEQSGWRKRAIYQLSLDDEEG